MLGVTKSQRMRNYAEQRISEFKRNLEAIVSQDPTVKEFREKLRQQQQEVRPEATGSGTGGRKSRKRKHRKLRRHRKSRKGKKR